MTKQNDRPRRRLTAPVALAALATSGLVVLTSGAVFTDSASVGSNSFTAGDVEISATETAAFTVPGGKMAPGDTINGQITVTNAGSLEHRYAISAVTTGDPTMANQLTVNATVDGTLVYTGPLANLKVGDPAQGAQTGDVVLAPAASDIVDLVVHLPLNSDNTFENLSADTAITFDAEQTANN